MTRTHGLPTSHSFITALAQQRSTIRLDPKESIFSNPKAVVECFRSHGVDDW